VTAEVLGGRRVRYGATVSAASAAVAGSSAQRTIRARASQGRPGGVTG
jgi:hypothetical protein